VSNAEPNVGDLITFTVTLTDHGPGTATNVTVRDHLPAGLNFAFATPTQGSYNSTTGVWTVGTVTTGGPQALTIGANVASPNALTNWAKVLHSDQTDPALTNNVVSATEHPQHADLALTETVNRATPNVGDTVTFTITLIDKGPQFATNVRVTDLLPAGLNGIGATPSQGSYIFATGVWTVGTAATGVPKTLSIQAQVVSPNVLTNKASVSHADQFDPVTTNNSAAATVHPQQADLGLTQFVNKPTANVGDTTLAFTVTLINHGPAAATDVSVDDLLPAGLTLSSPTLSRGSYTPGTGVWNIGTVAAGTGAFLTLHATLVSASAQTNTASVSHSDQFDPTTANNSASATVRPLKAELAISQLSSNSSPAVGETVLFTITLTNGGPDTATGVTVQDLLPAGLTLVSATPSRGVYSSGTWTIGTITAGTAVTLAIHAKPLISALFSNTATISHSDQFDPNTSDNSATSSIFAF
jgi:uncharacterized repeat protein (TIGR01451 family)